MLPFLKPKKMPGVITSKFSADGIKKEKPFDEGMDHQPLHVAAEAMIAAIAAKDAKALAKAFKDAFDMLESEPHEEGPHDEQI